jgi:phospholipase C
VVVAQRDSGFDPAPDKSHALDHIVVVLFENRSFDNVL